MSDPETGSNDVKGRMLPGIAAICLYLIVMTTANVYAGLTGVFGSGPAKYGSLESRMARENRCFLSPPIRGRNSRKLSRATSI